MASMWGLVDKHNRTNSISLWPLTAPKPSGKGASVGGQVIKDDTISEDLETLALNPTNPEDPTYASSGLSPE